MLDALAILLGGVVTYLTRAVFLVSKRVRAPAAVKRYLPLVGPAVLGAIAVPGILAPDGEAGLLTTVPSVAAALAAWPAWRIGRRQMVVGLAVWWGVYAGLVALGAR
ncbi:MAG: AzlD domain-containing protein [Protaetiibacter sp.]